MTGRILCRRRGVRLFTTPQFPCKLVSAEDQPAPQPLISGIACRCSWRLRCLRGEPNDRKQLKERVSDNHARPAPRVLTSDLTGIWTLGHRPLNRLQQEMRIWICVVQHSSPPLHGWLFLLVSLQFFHGAHPHLWMLYMMSADWIHSHRRRPCCACCGAGNAKSPR